MTDETTTTDVEADDATTALAPSDPMLDQVGKALTTGKADDIVEVELTPEEQQLRIVQRILESQTVDEILASFEATPIDDVLERPFELHRVRWERSEYEQGQPYYALLDATMIDTGESVTLTTGSTTVVAQLYALARKGALPQKMRCVQSSKPTSRGYYPKNLVRAV